jgi:quercetin dioxygenase-like cupin family protein
MRRGRRGALLFFTLACSQCYWASAAETTGGPVDLAALTWVQQSTGVQSAVFLGNPKDAGPYGVRAKIPPHWHIAPHTHPEEGRVATVIAGKFYWAKGETFDESQVQEFGPGSVIIEAKGVPHFAMTKDEGAVLQVTAIGPAGLQFSGEKK